MGPCWAKTRPDWQPTASLAPALTLPRITGREEVNDALAAYAQALGAAEAETVLADGRLDAAIFTGNVEGHTDADAADR